MRQFQQPIEVLRKLRPRFDQWHKKALIGRDHVTTLAGFAIEQQLYYGIRLLPDRYRFA
jgi:hypothetical protein